jgi:hypothetical protein
VRTAGIVLSGLGAASAAVAAWLVLRLRPEDFRERFDGGSLPILVRAQRPPAVLALMAAVSQGLGAVLIAIG